VIIFEKIISVFKQVMQISNKEKERQDSWMEQQEQMHMKT